jgi:hypothetical protein
MIYAGNNLDKARRIFERAHKNRPRIRLTVRPHMRVLDEWPRHGKNGSMANTSAAHILCMNISRARVGRSTGCGSPFTIHPSYSMAENTGRLARSLSARIGDLDHPIDFARMTHFVRNTDYGCEMRSRFWLGEIKSRDPEERAPELRRANVNDELARRLHQHASEEMGYLAEILPTLYKRATLDTTF